MAPRPSTPQGLPHGGSHGARSMSAPNSPARPGMIPGINRLPSQDSLDRSIHNESGHGKSTAQIIRDLKHSNAALSAKQASVEAQFMNQLSEVTKSFEDQRFKMDADIRALKKQLAHLEAYKAAADSKLKEKDSSLSKVKEESAFQRHSISDLKNQLYQLQTELEDAQQGGGPMMSRETRQEMEQLLTDNQEMARELAKLQTELRDSERARHEVERRLSKPGKPPAAPSSGDSPGGYYHKYQETHSELERHRKRLSATQMKMEGLEAEKQSLEQAHAKTLEELQLELVKQSELFQRREQDLMAQIESLEFTDSQVTINLKRELEQRDDAIAGMQEELEQYAEKAAELAAQLAQAQQAADSQEHYRRDEAEDLRILHDAQEEEITTLRKQLEDAQKELEMRDEELEESNARLEKVAEFSSSNPDLAHDEELTKVRNELEDTMSKLEKAESELASLRQSRDLPDKHSESAHMELEAELSKTRVEHEKETEELKSSIDLLTNEKREIAEKLAALEKEKNEVVSKFEVTNNEFSTLRSHWEGKAGAEKAAETLKKEIEIHRQRAHDASESERALSEKVQDLVFKVTELERQLEEQTKATAEAKSKLEEKLTAETQIQGKEKNTSEALHKAQAEIEELRQTIAANETGGSKTAKQLREAQIALVALDDEKKAMSQTHRELLMAVEKKKEEIQRMSQEQLAAKEDEIANLKKKLSEAETIETEEFTKLQERLAAAEALEADEMKKLREELSKVQSLEKEKIALEERVERLETSSRAVPVSPEPNMAASVSLGDATKAKLESTIRALTGEKEALRTKLKDRDTTIAALVRSSVSLESKIATMENEVHEVRSVQSEEKKVTEGELHELRKMLAMKNKEAQISEDVTALKKDLKLAKQDAKRWRRALEEEGGAESEYKYQINMLYKELDQNIERLKERDQAIENLVSQSISQDAHVKELKKRISSLMKEMEKMRGYSMLDSEVERLQQETEMFAGQIIEQDEEIQNLRRRLQQRDEQMQLLKQELSDLKDRSENSAPLPEKSEELERLKKDVSRITTDLMARDEEIVYLQKKLEEAKEEAASADPNLVTNLQAELDELKEANEDNRSELRYLRKQLYEAKQAAGETNDLKLELAQAKYAFDEYKRTQGAVASTSEEDRKVIEKLEADLKLRKAKIAELEKASVSRNGENEEQVAAFQKEIESLRNESASKTQTLDRLKEAIQSKDAALEKAENIKLKLLGELSDTKEALKKLEGETSQKQRSIEFSDTEKEALSKERDSLIVERDEISKAKDELLQEVLVLKTKIESLEEMQKEQDNLKTEFEESQQAREAAEKSIVDAYEKRISAVALDKDVTIDQLRKDLAESRGKLSEEADEMSRQLKSLQAENEGLREQFGVEMHAKNQQIYALEHTLHAQEQIVENMRAEMDQLQSGMEHATEKRRGEVEDLQQELMQLEGRSLKQDREITALKMQLEEGKLEHKAEVVRLKEALATMENEGPLAKTMAALANDDRMLEVRERLEQLKARNTILQEENLKLGGRLERKVIEIKSLEFEKARAEELEKENGSLRRQVNELGSILESGRPKSSRSSSSNKSMTSRDSNSSSSQASSQSSTTAIEKDTSSKAKEKAAKGKKGIKGLFKRRGFSSDDVIQEES